MEDWEPHMHLSGGRCFEMYFLQFEATIRFRIVGLDNFGNRTAINCSTGERFEFNREQLLKKEYDTLVEIDCENYAPQNDH